MHGLGIFTTDLMKKEISTLSIIASMAFINQLSFFTILEGSLPLYTAAARVKKRYAKGATKKRGV